MYGKISRVCFCVLLAFSLSLGAFAVDSPSDSAPTQAVDVPDQIPSDTDSGDLVDGDGSGDPGLTVDLSPDSIQAIVEAFDSSSVTPYASVDSAFSGGFYFICDCNLGKNVRFYVPAEWRENSLAFVGDSSNIVNLTNSTLYLYSPDFPGYSFNASRFNQLQYRTDNYGSYQTLRIDDILETNISFMQSNTNITQTQVLTIIVALLFLILIFVCVGRFRRS